MALFRVGFHRATAATAAITACLALVAGSLAGCSSSTKNSSAAGAATKHVKLALSYSPNGLLAGLASAIQRGTFGAAGLDVELVQPNSTSDSLKLLAGNSTDLALSSGLDQIVARSKGIDLVSVATTLQETGNGVMTRADSKITTLKQLEGHTVGFSGQIGPRAVFEDILRRNNVDLTKIKFVTVGFSGPQMLAAKRVDALGDTVSYQIGAFNAALGKAFDDSSTYWFKSYAQLGAVRFYGATICALQSYLDSNADTIRKFLSAWQQGMQWAIANPDDAVALEVKQFSQLKLPITAAQWKAAIPLVQSPATAAHGLGWQEPEVVSGMNDFLYAHKISSKSIDVDKAITNNLLPQK